MAKAKRVAVVTGGEEGIGLEICRRLAEAGTRVVLTSDDEAQGARAVQELDEEGHGILYVQLDTDDGWSVGRAVGFVEAALGRVDILVNAYSSAAGAGDVSQGAGVAGFGLSDQAAGMLRTGRGFGVVMQRGGYGRIVNVSSDAALPEKAKSGEPDHIVYAAVNAAVNAATRVLAVDCDDEKTDMKVNAVCVRAGKRYWAKDAETVVKLALLPPEGPTGTLFWAGEPVEV